MTIEKQTKQELDKILNRVGLLVFLMAVSHLYDVGYRHMTEECLQETVEEIKKEDDTCAFMTNGFKVQLLETAFEICQVAPPLELAKYVSKA